MQQSEIYRIAESELLAEENLLWAGQPDPMRLARTALPQAGFGLLWTGMVFFMLNAFGSMRFGSSGPPIFQLVLGLFLIVGLGLIGSPLYTYLKATRTVYVVTNRRLLIIEQFFPQAIKSYTDEDIGHIQRRGSRTNGDVIFATETRTSRSRSSSGHYRTRTYTVNIGFFGIPDADEVEALIIDIFKDDDRHTGVKKKKHEDEGYPDPRYR